MGYLKKKNVRSLDQRESYVYFRFDKKILIRSCFFFTTARIFVFFKKIQKYKKFFLIFLYYLFIRRFENRSLHYQE